MTVPDDAAIGGRLRQARTESRITQEEAAAALGIPRSSVSALEAGDRHLTAVELAKRAALYQRPAGWFLNDAPDHAQPPTAALPRADQDTVTRSAGFLAARQATAGRAPDIQLAGTPGEAATAMPAERANYDRR